MNETTLWVITLCNVISAFGNVILALKLRRLSERYADLLAISDELGRRVEP